MIGEWYASLPSLDDVDEMRVLNSSDVKIVRFETSLTEKTVRVWYEVPWERANKPVEMNVQLVKHEDP